MDEGVVAGAEEPAVSDVGGADPAGRDLVEHFVHPPREPVDPVRPVLHRRALPLLHDPTLAPATDSLRLCVRLLRGGEQPPGTHLWALG
jgi:hypothetical protein